MAKKYLGLAAGLLLLAGCSNNDFIDEGTTAPEGQMRTISTINATMDNADTRLYLDGNQVAWEDDDVIYAFSDGETTDWHEYSLSYLYPTTGVADFSGDELTGSEFYAFYPEPEIVNWTNHTATIPWDYDVIYDNEGVNTSSQIPLFAKSTNANMQFKQLGGLLHFQIYGEGQLESLSLTGNNEEEFSSAFDLDYGASEIKLVPNTSCESSATITEDFMKETEGKLPLLSKTEPFDVYIVLPAGMAFEHGFTLSGSAYVEDLDRGITRSVPFEQTTTSSFTVTRAEMANFPAISTTGILPTPEPEKGWISNYLDLSGTKVEMHCFVVNSKVDWQFAFYPDNGSGEGSGNVIAIEFFTDYEGGTPDLSWLIGTVIYDLEASRFHGPDGIIYRIGDSDGFKVKKNTDGTWYLSIENAKIHPNGSSTNIMEDFYLKFRGNFVGEEPEPTESLIGDDGVINTALLPNGYGGYQYDMWHFNLTDDEKYTVSFLRYPELKEDTSAIPTGTGSYDFYVTDNGKRYRAGYVPVTIVKNGDGTYTISVTDVYLNGEDGEPDVSGVSMTWTGTLNSYDESNGGGTLTIGGENISATYSEAVFSEDGWHLYFTNFQFPSSISADIKEYVENIARMTIVLTGEVGATEYPTVPSYNGDEFAFQIVDTNGNLLWYSMSEGETENSLQIHEDDDYIIRMSGNAKSVDGLKTSTVFFDWTGAIPRRH